MRSPLDISLKPPRHQGLVRGTCGIVTINKRSAKRYFFCGDELILEKLPIGTRVIYPRPPADVVPDFRAAVREAIEHPVGSDPLPSLLSPGMKVTIVIPDNASPIPLMKRPDVRQFVLELLLDLLADKGVDDVHVLVAVGLHRHNRPAEIERMVGPRVWSALAPDRIRNHDAEDPDGILQIGETESGSPVRINRRAAESDLVISISIGLAPLSGGHKSIAVGLADYPTIRVHHDPHTMKHTESIMDPTRSRMHDGINAAGSVIKKEMRVFQLEVVLNNRTFGTALDFLAKNEDEFSATDWLRFKSAQLAIRVAPTAGKRAITNRIRGAYGPMAVHAGDVEAAHAKTLADIHAQLDVQVGEQADIVIIGLPNLAPYRVASIQNPIITQVFALGYFFSFNRGTPVVRKGGTFIVCHPCDDTIDEATHPSYVPFYHELLAETRDAATLSEKYEAEYAANAQWIDAFRFRYAYHPAHPFFIWSWGERARDWTGRIIAAGAKNRRAAERIGWEPARNLTEAIDMARDSAPPNPSITVLHLPPPFVCDVAV